MPIVAPNPFAAAPHAVSRTLLIGRCALATQFLIAPVATGRLLGFDIATARRVSWLTRMMAVRDGAIGVGGLLAQRRGVDPTFYLVAGAVSDAVDAVVIADAQRQARLGGPMPALSTGGAAALAVLGGVTAIRLRRA